MNNFQQICRLQHYNTAGDQSIITASYMEVSHWSRNNPIPCGDFSLEKNILSSTYGIQNLALFMMFELNKGIFCLIQF